MAEGHDDAIAVVTRYLAAYEAGDLESVGACLTEDVVWDVHGHLVTTGQQEFLAEAARPGQDTRLEISSHRFLRSGDDVVVLGQVRAHPPSGQTAHLDFADVFHVRDGLIDRLDSYVVPLPPEE